MTTTLKAITLLAAITLLPVWAAAWEDQSIEADGTIVEIRAAGSDTQWINGYQAKTAHGLMRFAEVYNATAYRNDLTVTEKCASLIEKGLKAIAQRDSSFTGLHDVSCHSHASGPQLRMLIYPRDTFDYRFQIVFTPRKR